jgi:DNA-binding Lrp family transcriptional regulator
MGSAYILAKIEAGKEEEIFEEIRKSTEIEEANATYGVYDLVVRVNFKTVDELDEFIFGVLRRIPGVKETVTMIIAKEVTKK